MASVAVVGGGTAGAAAACSLWDRLPRKHQVTLVEQGPELFHQPFVLWLMVAASNISKLPTVWPQSTRSAPFKTNVSRSS
jgi:NADPH-dependent 2,4-dienoyl-CoA reductase/sulfur reductase-like enzyme